VEPFVPLALGAQVDILYSMAGNIFENRLWFINRDLVVDQTTIDALGVGVASHFETQLLPSLSSSCSLVRVDVRDWTQDPPGFINITNVFAAGGGNSDAHSANVAIRVRFNGTSNQTFRDNSNFIGGIPKDQVVLNTYSDTIRDAIFECYVDLIDDAPTFGGTAGWRWVITSRQLNKVFRTSQESSRTEDILFPSPYTSPRRKRLPD
jgi:hypothetical protein